jgi:hypothetical protein
VKFKTKRKAWNGPSPKSNTIYLENYNKIFKRKENIQNNNNRVKEDDLRGNIRRS